MLFPESTLIELRGALAQSAAQPWRVASVDVDVDPLTFARAGHAEHRFAGFFGRPSEVEIGALGVAWEFSSASGRGRLQRLGRSLPDVRGARFLFGYAFDDEGPIADEWSEFGAARVVLPRLAVVRDDAGAKLIAAAAGDDGVEEVVDLARRLAKPPDVPRRHAADRTIESVPAPGEWVEAVEETVAAIAEGAFEKVVLARSVVINSDIPADPFDLAVRLRIGYPGCFTYVWQEGRTAFVGASPELLASTRGPVAVSEPLAGTAPRGEGEDHDRLLGEQLMASPKNRLEHRVVVNDLAKRLADHVRDLSVPTSPTLRRMANVQHLSSHIEGRLRPGVGIFDLVESLHPTPAVGGSPSGEAVAMIHKMERIDRGWYSGGIGWTDGRGDGDVAIALRCALVAGSTARLFAGAGIVAGSDPQTELAETRLKFGPMLSLLTEA